MQKVVRMEVCLDSQLEKLTTQINVAISTLSLWSSLWFETSVLHWADSCGIHVRCWIGHVNSDCSNKVNCTCHRIVLWQQCSTSLQGAWSGRHFWFRERITASIISGVPITKKLSHLSKIMVWKLWLWNQTLKSSKPKLSAAVAGESQCGRKLGARTELRFITRRLWVLFKSRVITLFSPALQKSKITLYLRLLAPFPSLHWKGPSWVKAGSWELYPNLVAKH